MCPLLQWQKQRRNTAGQRSSNWMLQYISCQANPVVHTSHRQWGTNAVINAPGVSRHAEIKERQLFRYRMHCRYLSGDGGWRGEWNKQQNGSFLCGSDQLFPFWLGTPKPFTNLRFQITFLQPLESHELHVKKPPAWMKQGYTNSSCEAKHRLSPQSLFYILVEIPKMPIM